MMANTRTPSETLMSALEECETAEAALILVVHSDGTISWHASTDRLHVKLGMLEFVKSRVLEEIAQAERE
jgi:hypothetical protein